MSDEKKDKKSNDLPGWVFPVTGIVVVIILVGILIYFLRGYNNDKIDQILINMSQIKLCGKNLKFSLT